MADRFFDTSAIVKRYRVELGTPAVDSRLAETGAGHFISDLSVGRAAFRSRPPGAYGRHQCCGIPYGSVSWTERMSRPLGSLMPRPRRETEETGRKMNDIIFSPLTA